MSERQHYETTSGFKSFAMFVFFIALFALVVALIIAWVNTQRRAELNDVIAQIEVLPSVTERDWEEAEFESALAAVRLAEERALGYLGLFEAISFGLGSIGVVIAAVAIVGGIRYNDAMGKVSSATEELEDLKQQLQTLQTEVLQMAKSSNISLYEIQLAQQQLRLGSNMGYVQELYQHSLTMFPENPVPYYHIGYVLTQIDELDEAERQLKKSLLYDDNFAHAQAALGYVYRRMGDSPAHYTGVRQGQRFSRDDYYRLAEEWMTKGLENNHYITGDDGESWHGALGGVYKRWTEFSDNPRNKWLAAKRHYQEALKLTPRSSYPVVNLAVIDYALEDYKEGREYFQQARDNAIEKLKKEYDTYYDYADLLLSQIALVEIHYPNDLRKTSQAMSKDDKFSTPEFEKNIFEHIDSFLSLMPMGVANPLENLLKDLRIICNADDGVEPEIQAVRNMAINALEEELNKRKVTQG